MELEHRVIKAKEYFRKINIEALNVCKAYTLLKSRSSRLREEWLGLCGVMKAQNGKSCGYLTGLILLKQRVHDEYRDLRLASLRMMKKFCELSAETNRAYGEYMSLKKQLEEIKEDESCVRM